MDSLYDIYLTGKLAEGLTPSDAGGRLAQLFKADREAMTALFNGKPRLLKRGVDRNTALKYRDALLRIGIGVAFKAQPQPELAPVPQEKSAWSLAPVGADVLAEDERTRLPTPQIDTADFTLAPVGARMEEERTPLASAPDVSHLSLAAAGTELLQDSERTPPATAPTAGDWTMAPAGAPLETLPRQGNPHSTTAPDWSIAPTGAELLSPGERRSDTPTAPNTDHLRIVQPG